GGRQCGGLYHGAPQRGHHPTVRGLGTKKFFGPGGKSPASDPGMPWRAIKRQPFRNPDAGRRPPCRNGPKAVRYVGKPVSEGPFHAPPEYATVPAAGRSASSVLASRPG